MQTLMLMLSMIGPQVGAILSLVILVALFAPPRRALVALMLALVIIPVLMIAPALAQQAADTPGAPTAYSPNTLFHIPQAAWDQINAMVIGLLLALGGILWKWISERSPLKNTQAEAIAREAFTALLCNGAKYGLTQLKSAETRVSHVDVGHPAVAAAANYIIAQGPGLAAKLGFDVTTPEGRAAIIRMATIRVADLMTPPHAPPAEIPLPASVQPTSNSPVTVQPPPQPSVG